MSNRIVVASVAMASVVGSATAGQVFGNQADFEAAVPMAVLNDFNDVADGFVASYSKSFAQFSYEITATNGLFNDGGTISTQNANDALVITFTSGDVRAFGGDWWGTDIDFDVIAAEITIELDDGTTQTFNTNGPRFGGYISDTAISSITIAAMNSQGAPAWPTMDNFQVAVVPLPPAAWAGLGLLGVIGGVRAVRRRG